MPPNSRICYRIHQFRGALRHRPGVVPLDALRPHLNPAQITLFTRLHPSEQAHAYSVLKRLVEMGYAQPELLAAALLHDIGKILYPLSLWERVTIVLGARLFPRLARHWGEGVPQGMRRPFVVAARHPAWGADLVERTGAVKNTLELIRYHQDRSDHPELPLLAALQAVDESN